SASSASAAQVATAAAAGTAVPAAYAPPRADPRATSYGFGVPLRPRTGPAALASAGTVALRPYAPAREVPTTRDPTVPSWVQLPAASSQSTASKAPAGGAGKRVGGRTDCGCGCGPRGGAR
ncbi:MAG: hypothetical protein AB1941_13980, partial [Gemmatimonadota bacterium]